LEEEYVGIPLIFFYCFYYFFSCKEIVCGHFFIPTTFFVLYILILDAIAKKGYLFFFWDLDEDKNKQENL